ncbi:hypothetical protein, partial [Acinetobacter johnsonii]|uniref:hypothetical protein n=1 Tax=Acinetobacter johnsonii TaxID=40214 RepID=UPI001F218A3A
SKRGERPVEVETRAQQRRQFLSLCCERPKGWLPRRERQQALELIAKAGFADFRGCDWDMALAAQRIRGAGAGRSLECPGHDLASR